MSSNEAVVTQHIRTGLGMRDILLVATLLGVVAITLTESLRLGLGTLQQPGPGAWPFVVGVALSVCSLGSLMVRGAVETEDEPSTKAPIVGSLLAAAFVPIFFVVGPIIAVAALMVAWMVILGKEPWWKALVTGVVTAGIVYLTVGLALQTPLPAGIF